MVDPHLLERIRTNPEVFDGKPIIRDLRISVELILSLLAQGETVENLLDDYPGLEPDDVRACTSYAVRAQPRRASEPRAFPRPLTHISCPGPRARRAADP